MEEEGKLPEIEKNEDHEKIFSKVIRAGKRTYFFDVRATKKNDYFLTLTESKKRFDVDGHSYFEKHKIFLYKEDFDKFSEGLHEVIDYIKSVKNEALIPDDYKEEPSEHEKINEKFANIEFEDLGNK